MRSIIPVKIDLELNDISKCTLDDILYDPNILYILIHPCYTLQYVILSAISCKLLYFLL